MLDEIKALVRQYYSKFHADRSFRPGIDWVPVSGKSFGSEELEALVQASLEFWLTAGPYAKLFEQALAQKVGVPRVHLTNSGSSANLLSVSTLCSNALGDRKLKPGDEVISSAVGFPTTVNPVLQNNLSLVLVDPEVDTLNPTLETIEAAITSRTRAVILAHTLGNPLDIARLKGLCTAYGLYLIEDCCDVLGGEFDGKTLGSWGDLASFSFYPAHHITTGEGGAVACSTLELAKIVVSLRDWGRHCWCEPGHDNTCGRRYGWSFPGLPTGYDHKYVYSEVGYNLKMTDLQASIGLVQLSRLDEFARIRELHFRKLDGLFRGYEDWFVLPRSIPNAQPSWFGYPVTIKPSAPFSRRDMIRYLHEKRIASRLVFGGNLTRQPAYERNAYMRASGNLVNSDLILTNSFWLGVSQALDDDMVGYVLDCLKEWLDGGGKGPQLEG